MRAIPRARSFRAQAEGPSHPALKRRLEREYQMGWWIAYAVVGFAGFLYDHELAKFMPISDLTLRTLMTGAAIGLTMGFTIHVFQRPLR